MRCAVEEIVRLFLFGIFHLFILLITNFMKKFFFLTGVALCALTLATSCVKDIESASVTSLRNAKTEQILASAELSRAQAAAATLTAQADANLKNAQAELAKAQAELANAQTEAAKAQAQYQIQTILNQMEMDQIQFEYDMAKLIADLEKQKADDAISELNLAAMNYRNAVNNLINNQSQLNNLKTSLARNEVSQADWENTKAKNIANYKHLIAQEQAKIEVYKQYANYTEDIDALKDKYDALRLKSNKLNDDWQAARDKHNEANNQRKHKSQEAATKKLEENPFWQVFIDCAGITLSDGETEVYFWDTKAVSWLYRWTNWEWKDVTIYSITDEDGNVVDYRNEGYSVITSNATVDIDGISGKIEEVNADVINMRIKEDKAAYAAVKEALDDALETLNDELTPLKEDMAAKLAELNAIEVDADGYDAAKTAYEAAVKAVNDKQGDIDDMNENIKTAAEKSEAYDIIADFVVNYAENCKTVAALYDGVGEGIASDWKDFGDTYVAQKKAYDDYDAVNTEVNAIYAVLYGYTINAEGANSLDQWIKGCENNIKNYQAQIDNYDLNNTSFEQTIETAKKNIALQEEYIKSLEVIANQRKAEYEAVLAKYQNAE